MRDNRFWSNSAKYVGENLAACHANLHGRVYLHPHAAASTLCTAKVALVNGAPLKGVVRNASTNAAWPPLTGMQCFLRGYI